MVKKAVVNVGLLDLRHVTPGTWEQVCWIKNVGTIICAADPGRLLAGRTMLNTGPVFKAPPDGELNVISTSMSFSRGYLEGRKNLETLVVRGSAEFDPDVTVQDVEKAIAGLIVSGSLTCPEHLLDALQARLQGISGSIRTYRCPPGTPFTRGVLVLDQDYVQKLEDGSELAVLGKLRLPQVLPNELLERKLHKLYVTGQVMCHEENAQLIESLLADPPKKIKVIPAGFELVARPLELTNTALESLPCAKLYCTRRVQVAADVDPTLLDARLETLVCEDLVLCPSALKKVMAQKSNWFETRAIFYEGELWVVDDERDLPAHSFDMLEGQATLVVFGELRLDPAIAPQTLGERLDKVHNLGEICCTPAQAEAIRALLGLRDGDLEDFTETEYPLNYAKIPDDCELVGNSGYLAL
jgi:hypothetical protein